MNVLLQALEAVTGTGRFCSTGSRKFFFPEIRVSSHELAFPLCPEQIRAVLDDAESASYGQGEQTVHDPSVRKCWQVDASNIRIEGTAWTKYLNKVVRTVAEELGVEGAVEATLYKLLIYGEGGHFKAHRDTEKLDAMFGTLIIHLPSRHEGGCLEVRHGDEAVSVDFSAVEHLYDFQHAAFFADCEHQVEPVGSGYRCCLVYNLTLQVGDPSALNRATDAQADLLVPALKAIQKDFGQEPLAVLLEHQYTEANFSLQGLKGHDQSRARALIRAAERVGLRAHLALVTLHQQGMLEGVDFHYGRRRYWDDDEEEDFDDGTIGEIYEENLSVDNWINSKGVPAQLGSFPLDETRLLSPQGIESGEPVEKFGEGPTGNAGCTMDYWYRRASVVLWPVENDALIRVNSDPRAVIEYLQRLLATGTQHQPVFSDMAEALIERYGNEGEPVGYLSADLQAASLRVIAEAGNRSLFDEFVDRVAVGHWRDLKVDDFRQIMQAFGSNALSEMLDKIVASPRECLRAMIFNGLTALMELPEPGDSVAKWMEVTADFTESKQATRWGNTRNDALVQELSALIAGSGFSENKAVRQAVLNYAKGDGSLDSVRFPLADALLSQSLLSLHYQRKGSLYWELRRYAVELLREEVGRALEPYPDWARPSPEKVAHHYPELDAFLKDPGRKEWVYPALKQIRESMHDFIKRERLDLDCRMLRQGSPHKIVCTKNSASLKRARARRKTDEALLEELAK